MPSNSSLAESLASLEPSERQQLLQALTESDAASLLYDWHFWARPNQLPPTGIWLVWLLIAGRGFGKTRCGAEFIRQEVEAGRASRIHLVAKTPADARDVMVEGDSGILKISPPWFKPIYQSSTRSLTWPNGAKALIFSSAEPDQLRGPQCDLAWGDEIRTWLYPVETWDNLMFGLRLGQSPRCVATTTPSPIHLIKRLMDEPTTVITRGTTFENRANLAPGFFDLITKKYEGTTIGRQELYAELLNDIPGALWNREIIKHGEAPKELVRVVVAIDPAVTSGENSDETGIIAAAKGRDNLFYVLADRSGRMSPRDWALRAANLYQDYHADRVIGEANNGGDMIEQTLRNVAPNIPYRSVHASRGKQARAEPISALYEQGKVIHVGQFTLLEDQQCTYTGQDNEKSPDRMDALVWALSELSKPSGGLVFA